MLLSKPWLLTHSLMDDLITILNILFKGKTFKVSRKWYNKMIAKGYFEDINFNLVVVNKCLTPQIPELCEEEEEEVDA